ncbi:MAG: hypothetical protein FJZ64_00420 [Chlamydiae bacterium]|nr:hypothetical protein [Chlamydiota bacterium]
MATRAIHFGPKKEIQRFLETYFASTLPHFTAKRVNEIVANYFKHQILTPVDLENRVNAIAPAVARRLHARREEMGTVRNALKIGLSAYLQSKA